MSGPRFDAALPTPHSERWRDAHRVADGEAPRMASYRPPGGEEIQFILGGMRFSGGHSRDAAEYPFGGLWSSEWLNEKPQKLSVDGFLRGGDYIAGRNALVEALRVRTDDDAPGILDLPFWGRFPVVVGDGYEVSESSDEQGQCRLSIPFTRAGAAAPDADPPPASADAETAAWLLMLAAVNAFVNGLPRVPDMRALRVAIGQINNALLGITGRIQGLRTLVGDVTNGVLGTLGLLDSIVGAPRELALAVLNAAASIAGGLAGIRNSAAMYARAPHNPFDPGDGGAPMGGGGPPAGDAGGGYPAAEGAGTGGPSLPPPDNERNVLLMFLSEAGFALSGEAATVGEAAMRAAVENLYKTAAFLASVKIVDGMDSPTRGEAAGYWRLLERLGESVDGEDPAVHGALRDALSALSRKLSAQGLASETTRAVPNAAPLLYLAHYLGCDEDALRRLNRIPDSFVVGGEVTYV